MKTAERVGSFWVLGEGGGPLKKRVVHTKTRAKRGGGTERAKTISVDSAGPFNIGAQRLSFLVNKGLIFLVLHSER
jgi:hypothetical protein